MIEMVSKAGYQKALKKLLQDKEVKYKKPSQ